MCSIIFAYQSPSPKWQFSVIHFYFFILLYVLDKWNVSIFQSICFSIACLLFTYCFFFNFRFFFLFFFVDCTIFLVIHKVHEFIIQIHTLYVLIISQVNIIRILFLFSLSVSVVAYFCFLSLKFEFCISLLFTKKKQEPFTLKTINIWSGFLFELFILRLCRAVESFSWCFLFCTVAKRSWCQHFVLDISLANGNMVFGRVELFTAGHWTWRWASIW